MSKISERRIPPLVDDKKFEQLCRDLWRRAWNDPHAECNGRSGQKQNGVDVFGRPDKGSEYAGVQCKAVETLTEGEIREEVEKAKSFTPSLRELIIATTVPRDVHHQAVARHLTLENNAEGLFPVSICSWNDILEMLDEHPDLVTKYLEVDQLQGSSVTMLANAIGGMEQGLHDRFSVITASPSYPPVGEFHQDLNLVKDRINSHRIADAHDLLHAFRDRFWHAGDDEVRYRIVHYEGVIFLHKGRERDAADRFLVAHKLKPADDSAGAYLALAYLLLGDRPRAFESAIQALIDHPTQEIACQVLIQAAEDALTFQEIEAMLSPSQRGSSQVAFAFASRAVRLGDLDTAEHWARIALASDPPDEADPLGETHALLGNILMERAFAPVQADPFLRRTSTSQEMAAEAERHLSKCLATDQYN